MNQSPIKLFRKINLELLSIFFDFPRTKNDFTRCLRTRGIRWVRLENVGRLSVTFVDRPRKCGHTLVRWTDGRHGPYCRLHEAATPSMMVDGSLPSTGTTTIWLRPSSSIVGMTTALLSGAQIE